MIKRIAHVGIAARSITASAKFFRLLGLEVKGFETVAEQGVKVALIEIGDSALELIQAVEGDSAIRRFVEKRGEGLHHITLEVDDLEEQLRMLRENDIRLIDETPRKGAGGSCIAFVHPDSTGGVLVELSQLAVEEET